MSYAVHYCEDSFSSWRFVILGINIIAIAMLILDFVKFVVSVYVRMTFG